jgi:hypothetical protein
MYIRQFSDVLGALIIASGRVNIFETSYSDVFLSRQNAAQGSQTRTIMITDTQVFVRHHRTA